MKRLAISLFLFLTACGVVQPAPHGGPDAGHADALPDAGTTTCAFDQSAFDRCVLAP